MPSGLKPRILAQLHESSRVLAAMGRQAPRIAAAAELLLSAYRKGNKVLVFGNGGSAADAQHLAAELVGRFARNRPALCALALTVNTSDITAIGNDFGFAEIFTRQLEAHARRNDVAVAISTSGNSPNVLQAVLAARKLGVATIALTGGDGGRLKDAADVCIRVPARRVARIQEAHVAVIHVWCDIVEGALFPDSPRVH